MKVCGKCKESKPLEEFSERLKAKDGKHPHCRPCVSLYYKEFNNTPKRKVDVRRNVAKRYASIREKYIDYKKTQQCADCGNDDFRVIEFDHLGDKVMNVSDAVMNGWSWKKIVAEIEKCDAVCSNCHSIRTYERRSS